MQHADDVVARQVVPERLLEYQLARCDAPAHELFVVALGTQRFEDRVLQAREPRIRVASREDDLGGGGLGLQLLPERARRPVDRGAVPGEYRFGIERFPADRARPGIDVTLVRVYLDHVVAGPEAELIERRLTRHRAGAAETRTDHVEHGPTVMP